MTQSRCWALAAALLALVAGQAVRANDPNHLVQQTYPISDLLVPSNGCRSGQPAAEPSTEELVIQFITRVIAPESWQEQGGPGSICYSAASQSLVVIQAPAIQQRVADLMSTVICLHHLSAQADPNTGAAGCVYSPCGANSGCCSPCGANSGCCSPCGANSGCCSPCGANSGCCSPCCKGACCPSACGSGCCSKGCAASPAVQAKKCCCDGSTPCAEGCKPDNCCCKDKPACQAKKCCCDGSTPCAEGCKPDNCCCKEKSACQAKKCCCDGSTPCAEGCKPDNCCCKTKSSCQCQKGCCESCEPSVECMPAPKCGPCCCSVKAREATNAEARSDRSFAIVVCPCPCPLMGLPGVCGPFDCLGWMAQQIAELFNDCPLAQCAYPAAPAAYAPPMPPPCPMMPPMPCPMGLPAPPVVPCMAPPMPVRCGVKWVLRHESDAIHIAGPGVEGVCDRVVYLGQGDNVILEGKVRLKYNRESQKAQVSAERIGVNLGDGQIQLNVPKMAEEPAVTDLFRFSGWFGNCN